ncbi:MAG TPA: TIM-barrel domain-containing protein, partial [Solirubrobacteraceae bacterium]|nr:TIM-barrel domain-containing protein [Solirubrobacteraceae bacterium]
MRRVVTQLILVFVTQLVGATAGYGQVVLTPSQVRVAVAAGGPVVIVDRRPFRLRIVARGCAGGLSEVANSRPRSAALSPTVDPLAPGVDAARSGQLYAPLSFLVGRESLTQYDGSVWGGNLQSGTRSGIQYAARDVVSAQRRGRGAQLTLSTDDPSGRRLSVLIAPAGAGIVRVLVVPHPATGVAIMSDAFVSSPREAFYGFGGRHNALDQHGRVLSSFVAEENLPGIAATGPAAILYPNGPTAAYYPQAQFVSSRGYGFLLDQPQLARFRLDSDRRDAWSVAVSSPSLSYDVAVGSPARAIASLTSVSGRQPAPPRWALGPMFDRLVKNVGETEADYESSLASDIANFDRYHLPVTAYRIEGWGFPGSGNDGLALHTWVSSAVQSRTIADLRTRHIHPLAYLRPWITPGSAPDRQGLTVHHPDGSTWLTTSTTGHSIALLDFTNPAAVRFWQREVAKVLDLGFDGFMQDFGEEVLYGMRFHDGSTGVTMHNRYLVLFMRATRAEFARYERAHPARQLWFFNRAGYSGTPGSAAYEGGNFPGDEATNWGQASGLASSAPDMLSRAIGGAFGFATDIGGYYDITTPPTTKQLFLRWAEWAALSPIFRLHGSGLAGTHAPWTYDAETVRAYRALSLLHERAAPLILRLWREADRTGIPPTRPLWLQFPGDPRAAAQQQEWTLGDDVLVAPVVSEGAVGRSVYFPAGCWR